MIPSNYYSASAIKSNSAVNTNLTYGSVSLPNVNNHMDNSNKTLYQNLKNSISYNKTGRHREERNFGSRVIERME